MCGRTSLSYIRLHLISFGVLRSVLVNGQGVGLA